MSRLPIDDMTVIRTSATGAAWWRLAEPVAARIRSPHTLFVEADRVFAWTPKAVDGSTIWPNASEWFDAHRGHAVRVVLSNTLTHQVVANPELPLDEPMLLNTWARQQFATYHGSVSQGWPVATWLLKDQKGACALPHFDLVAVRGAARAARVTLRSVEPLWSVALAAASKRLTVLTDAAGFRLGLVEGRLLTWLACEDGRVIDVMRRRLSSATSAALIEVVEEALSEVAVNHPVALIGHGMIDDGPWPSHWSVPDRLDVAAPAFKWLAA